MVLTTLIAARLALGGPRAASAPGDAASARYAVAERYAGVRARLHLRDARSRRLRSALEDAYDGEVDFAGRYVLAEIGCGAGCIEVAALDVQTGAVHWLPATVSSWPEAWPDPLEHSVGSRLLVVHGRLNERGGAGPHIFVFEGGRFTPQ